MSFIENDPLKLFLSQDLWLVAIITFFIGWPIFLIIDSVSSLKDNRIHWFWGTWVRWYSNWLGDTVFLTAAVVFAAWFYQEADSGPSHIFAGGRFWIAIAAMGLAVPTVFLALEELAWKSYQGQDKWNANRIYHSAYMAFMGYILLGGAFRAFGAWTYTGGYFQAIGGLIFFSGWVVTEILDNKFPPVQKWREIEQCYPGRTKK